MTLSKRLQSALIVEDDPAISHVVQLALERVAGWRTWIAGDGETALAIAEAEQPDVVVLDVMLPRLSGPETLRRLASHPSTTAIPVVFMTARVQPHERARYAELGAVGVVAKPFDPMVLGHEIQELVDGAASGDPCRAGPSDAPGRPEIVERRARELVTALEKCVDDIHGDGGRHALELAHKLRGAAGTFGAPEVGLWAGQAEDALRAGSTAGVQAALVDLAAFLSRL